MAARQEHHARAQHDYTDGPKPLLDKVELTINDGSVTNFELKGLQNGDFDYARINPDDLKATAQKYHTDSQDTNGFIKVPVVRYQLPAGQRQEPAAEQRQGARGRLLRDRP